MRTCPISGNPMKHETLHGVEVDVSEHGVWLDRGELLLVTEVRRHADPSFMFSDLFRRELRPPVDRARVLACPDCGKPMEVTEHHGVHVDWCRDHGIWLDGGELEAILNNLRLDKQFVNKIATRLWEARF